MLDELDKKLEILINRKIKKIENKEKFNFFNPHIMSVGWVFVINIFIFVLIGYLINRYITKSYVIFILVIFIGIILAFINLFRIIENSDKKNPN
jgi:F0F1-type ATP synthase assembly protein I